MTYNARFLWITTSPQRKLCEFYRGLLFGHKNNMFCYYCCCCPLLLSSSLQESSLLRYRRLTTQFQHIVIVWRLFVRDFQYSRRSCWLWNEPKGAFHLSELTGQTIPVVMSSPWPLFQNEGRCSVFDMEIIFHSHANKTHFESEGFGTRKRPISLGML